MKTSKRVVILAIPTICIILTVIFYIWHLLYGTFSWPWILAPIWIPTFILGLLIGLLMAFEYVGEAVMNMKGGRARTCLYPGCLGELKPFDNMPNFYKCDKCSLIHYGTNAAGIGLCYEADMDKLDALLSEGRRQEILWQIEDKKEK